MSSQLFWVITQSTVFIPYRRFGTTYRSHLPRAKKAKKERRESRITWPLEMGLISCPETSVSNYHYTLRNIPEDLSSSSYHQSSLMSPARCSSWKLFVRMCVPVAGDSGKANVNNWNCVRRAARLDLFKYFRSIKNKPYLLAVLWRRRALVPLVSDAGFCTLCRPGASCHSRRNSLCGENKGGNTVINYQAE